MKSEIFSKAILNRNKVKMLYNLQETTLEPYLLSKNRNGKKVVFGRINNSPKIIMVEFDKILNLKILKTSHFLPLIPILN